MLDDPKPKPDLCSVTATALPSAAVRTSIVARRGSTFCTNDDVITSPKTIE
ncbi:MAG TPA: hypothetical protein VEI02_03610 [Planctomycetota bacterium]|nr:hypothetical protein [Planctomycetota bacterium]